MKRARRLGASAAATLPAALFAGVLVGAPFAGTTTAPLAHTQPASAQTTGSAASQHARGEGLNFSVSGGDVAVLAGFELGLVAVGGGVIVTAVRRHRRAAGGALQRNE